MMRKILFISVLFIICEMITEIVLRYPCNHGNNFYVHAVALAFFLLLSLINLKKNIGVIVGAFIGLLFVLGVNYFNVGIDYDTWIERGMPEWGEYSTCPSPMNRRKGFETIPATDTDHAQNPHIHSPYLAVPGTCAKLSARSTILPSKRKFLSLQQRKWGYNPPCNKNTRFPTL